MSFFKKIRSLYYFFKAMNFIQDNKDAKAYYYLYKIDKDIIKKNLIVEYYLYLGLSSGTLKKIDESESNFKKAIYEIENNNSLKYNSDEKYYLNCYALVLLYYIFKYLDKDIITFKSEINELKNLYDESNVRRRLLYSFPINEI